MLVADEDGVGGYRSIRTGLRVLWGGRKSEKCSAPTPTSIEAIFAIKRKRERDYDPVYRKIDSILLS